VHNLNSSGQRRAEYESTLAFVFQFFLGIFVKTKKKNTFYDPQNLQNDPFAGVLRFVKSGGSIDDNAKSKRIGLQGAG